MQKDNIPCINTSTFAKLCNTSKRTLIHYDSIGLFKPAHTDEKGYRYYSESQCDVFFTITCLKDLGMPLSDIKDYISRRSPESLTALLLEQQKEVERELLHLKRIEQVIKAKLALVNAGTGLQFTDGCSVPRLEHHDEAFFLASPRLDTSDHALLFPALCEHIGHVSHENLSIGHPYGAMMRVADLEKGITDRYAYFITRIEESCRSMSASQSLRRKSAGSYAVIYLQGDYYHAEKAFQKLFDFIHDRELTAGEFCYKEAVWDELTASDKEHYITRISIPMM